MAGQSPFQQQPEGLQVCPEPHWKEVDFPACYPQFNPVDGYRKYIAHTLSSIAGKDAREIYTCIQRSTTLDKGDLVIPVPALKIKGERVGETVGRWVEEFPSSTLLHKPQSDSPFIRFFFQPAALMQHIIPSILRYRSQWGWGHNPSLGLNEPQDPARGRKRILIEFSSPNIAKPFHQGHLRSTIIGGFLANLYEGAGWDVVRLNYLGDWGKQYGLLALGFEMLGDERRLEEDPIQHLFSIYVKINELLREEREEIHRREEEGEREGADELKCNGLDERARRYFKAMCDNAPDAIALWRKFRALSVEKYKASYARLNIHFDEYTGESQVSDTSMKIAECEMEKRELLEQSDGATIVDFSKHVSGKEGTALGKALIRKRDGTSLYLTRDIGALFQRNEHYRFDQMIYVVATDQELHLKQLFKIIELIDGSGDLRSRIMHVNFGLVLGMSTRRGTVVFLDDVLREVGERMHGVMKKNESKYARVSDPKKTADILAISSVMVQDMSGKRINNYHFNIETMTSFEGDTGPYLQYSHARLCSIFSKAGIPSSELLSADLSLLVEPHATDIVRLIAQFPDTVQNTLRTLEPTTVLTYLFRLTHKVNSSYDILKVMGSDREVMKARMALYEAARTVLGNGMRVLGLTPLDRM